MTTYDPATAINVALSNGNLTATLSSGALGSARVATSKSTGKYYFEFTIISASNSSVYGLLLSTANYVSGSTNDIVAAYGSGNIDTNNAFSGNSVGTINAADALGIAIDLTARKVWIRKNIGNWNGIVGADPATGVSGLTVQVGSFAPFAGFASTAPAGAASTLNLGATAFVSAVPAGFVAWDVPIVHYTMPITFGAILLSGPEIEFDITHAMPPPRSERLQFGHTRILSW